VRKRVSHNDISEPHAVGKLAAAIGRHPREFVGMTMATVAIFAICINALYLQKGPHPAPIFASRPLLKQAAPAIPPRTTAAPSNSTSDPATLSRVQLISDIQRELNRRGFYDGTVDGIWGAKTDAATRDFIQAAGLKINPDVSESLLRVIVTSKVQNKRAVTQEPVRNDPIAELIAPTKRVLAIQRALSEFGYGQIKPTGTFDADTRTAIEKFERDHRLPVTGQISDRFVRELAAMTGRPLE
jgi:peptidoglycan hydrolase-like protein with peptidoglycan-binding domain